MKVLLVFPPYSLKELYPEFMVKQIGKNESMSIGGSLEPLGLLYLVSFLREKNHTVKVIDGYYTNRKEILKEIRNYNPQLIGLAISTVLWDKTKEFIKDIKKHFSDKYIVVGGPFPSAWKEKCLIECSEIDFVSVGESEETLLELCEQLDKHDYNFQSIKGLIFKKGGKVISNHPRRPIQKLDSIPFPARDLMKKHDYIPACGQYKRLPNAIMIASRGCTYKCAFCYSSKMFRKRSPENVAGEIESLINDYGIKNIIFFDETITQDDKHITGICKEIIKRKIDITWSANSRVDTINKEKLRLMKKAGCWKVMYGMESGVQKNIDFFGKKITLDQIKNTVKITREIGLKTFGGFILGIPGETFNEGLKTIEFAINLNLDYVKFKTLQAFPGTYIYYNCKKFGRITCFSDMDTHKASFIPYTMTKEELEKLFVLSYKKFYRRPRYIIKKIFEIRSIEDVVQNLRAGSSFFYIKNKNN